MANHETSDQWELSKENIQPLKQGRNASVLSVALDESSTQKLNGTRHEFEEELRTYSGDDPLDVWYRYTLWVEQNYPKGGKQRDLMKLIEKCVMSLHSHVEQYTNDLRFLNIWIKYANLNVKPLDVYQVIEKKGLFTSLAEFYINWSWELEKIGNHRQADIVYQKGLNMAAQPIHVLQEAHKKFQTRVTRSTLEGNIVTQDAYSSEPQRIALTALKPQGRGNRVATERVSSAIGPAGRVQQNHVKENTQAPGFSIFQDNARGASAPVKIFEDKGGSLPVGDRINQENIKKAGQWTKAKVRQKTVGIVPVEDIDKFQKPSFHVLEDENAHLHTPAKPIPCSNVLSARKSDYQDWKVDLFVAEPFNPKVQPQYCKHKVYYGTEEFSFEELRAAVFFKKEKEEKKKQRDFEEMRDMLKKQEEMIAQLLQQQTNKSEKKAPPSLRVTLPTSPPRISCKGQQPEQSKESSNRNIFQDSWVCINKSLNVSANVSHISHSMDENSTRALLQCQPEIACFSSKESSLNQDPTPGNATGSSAQGNSNNASRSFNMTEPTVDTKKALDDMFSQSFYHGDSPQVASDLSLAPVTAPEPLEKDNTPFSIYQDGCDAQVQVPKEEKPMPFQIFSDGLEGSSTKSTEMPQIKQEILRVPVTKESASADPNDQYPEAQDENCPPAGLVQQRRTRKIFGALQPSRDIPFQPLDQKEEDQLEDVKPKEAKECLEMTEDLDGIMFLDGTMGDFTLKMPNNLETFAKHAKVASTPAPFSLGKDLEPSICLGTDNGNFPLIKSSEEDEEEKKENSGDLMPPPPPNAGPSSPASASTKTGLSPIMEASREFTSSSSSSPGHSSATFGGQSIYGVPNHRRFSTSSHMSRSRHNSNSQPESVTETGISGMYTQGDFTKSGYLADKSRGESMADSKPCVATSQLGSQKKEEILFSNQAEAMLMDLEFMKPPSAAPVTKMEMKETKIAKVSFPENINPFSEDILNIILSSLDEPLQKRGGYVALNGSLPPVTVQSQVTLGREMFHIRRVCGEGSYAVAYLASTLDALNVTVMPTEDDDDDDKEKQIILKVQSPVCPWEFYICHELRKRLKTRVKSSAILDSVMRINRGYFSSNQSILINEYHKYGTVLDAINAYRTNGQSISEAIAMYWMVEILTIIEAIHKCGIIHADIKPDNFLVKDIPSVASDARTPVEMFGNCPCSLKLIDFGRSIDMEKFPPETTFTEEVTTDKFTCCEMREGKEWTYQTDLFGAAAIAHLLIFGSYMEVKKSANGKWELSGVSIRRYWQKNLWQEAFSTLLNVPSCSDMPDLTQLREKFMTTFYHAGFHKQIATAFANFMMLNKRR
ncbi:hypothetical protein Pmani_016640 [Petrolisthes manimaculis]|uniref:Mitotic checkpoint serine/threonine-protein kinase BUB1 n=1 Tax=Petrolisthes manimaculis TaxID=1843537 RepID=A0AAE1PP12_9EUCA|nr:hypothetical protein Pmani_016640 [Petrolisthes manimaculis]